jgi:periplasmic divalent cation tolerance protein
MHTDKIKMAYITTSNMQEATTIANALVSEHLAACANIIDNMHSIYHWDGKLQKDKETILIAKTTDERIPELITRVKSLHSYECPCIVCLSVTDGIPAFLAWVAEQVE